MTCCRILQATSRDNNLQLPALWGRGKILISSFGLAQLACTGQYTHSRNVNPIMLGCSCQAWVLSIFAKSLATTSQVQKSLQICRWPKACLLRSPPGLVVPATVSIAKQSACHDVVECQTISGPCATSHYIGPWDVLCIWNAGGERSRSSHLTGRTRVLLWRSHIGKAAILSSVG